MKTITIGVDDDTLDLIDELREATPVYQSRSAWIRAAIREFAAMEARRHEEEKEREILRKNKSRLDEELEELMSKQAR